MIIWHKYGTAAQVEGVPLITRGLADFKANPTLAAGDWKIAKDGGTDTNLTTLPSAVPASSSHLRVSASATEMQCKYGVITGVDQSSPKEWEDQRIILLTYGNASALYPGLDLTDAVRLGLTALPNAAAEAAGGLYTRGTGAGQINQDANGRIDARVAALVAEIITAASIAAGAVDEATFAADTDKYQAKAWLLDDNVGTADRYVVAWFKNGEPVVAGITSPTIQVVKVADATDLVASTAMTQIGTTGLYRYVEATNRVVDGTAYVAKVAATIASATRTWYQPVGRDSK